MSDDALKADVAKWLSESRNERTRMRLAAVLKTLGLPQRQWPAEARGLFGRVRPVYFPQIRGWLKTARDRTWKARWQRVYDWNIAACQVETARQDAFKKTLKPIPKQSREDEIAEAVDVIMERGRGVPGVVWTEFGIPSKGSVEDQVGYSILTEEYWAAVRPHQPKDETPDPKHAATQVADLLEKASALSVACEQARDEPDSVRWTKDGKPFVTSLEKIIGTDITEKERDAAWRAVK